MESACKETAGKVGLRCCYIYKVLLYLCPPTLYMYNPPPTLITHATLVGVQRELKSSFYHVGTPDSVRHVLTNALDPRIGNVLYAEQELI